MHEIEIEFMRTGSFNDGNNKKVIVDHKMLDEIVGSYDLTNAAPLVFGHPKENGPAYGWVKSLRRIGDRVVAIVEKVPDAVRELIASGAYRKVSASFFPSNFKNNPVPGKTYLRHIGLLGATPPAIKGLAEIKLSGSDDGSVTIDFSEASDGSKSAGSEFRAVLEKIIETLSAFLKPEEIEDLLPKSAVDFLDGDGNDNLEIVVFNEAYDALSGALEKRLKTVVELSDNARKNKNKLVCDQAIKEGRLTPANGPRTLDFLDRLDDETPIEFSDGENSEVESMTLAEQYRKLLASQPPCIILSEVSQADASTDNSMDDAQARALKINKYRDEKNAEGINLSAADAARELGYVES